MAETNQQALERIRAEQKQTDAEIARETAVKDRLEEKLYAGTATPAEERQYIIADNNLETLNRRKSNLYGAEARADDAVLLQGADQTYESNAPPAYMSGGRIENDFGGTPEPPPENNRVEQIDRQPLTAPISGYDGTTGTFIRRPQPPVQETPAPAGDPQGDTINETVNNAAYGDGLNTYDQDFTQVEEIPPGYPTPVTGGRGSIVEQPNERADALAVERAQEYGGGRGSVVEQPNERADALAVERAQEYGGGRGSVVEQPGERQEELQRQAQENDPAFSADPFADGGDVQDIGEEIVPIRENLNPEPVLATDPVVNDIDEFSQEERDLQNPDGDTKSIAEPVLATDPVVNDIDEFSQEERDLQNPEGDTKIIAKPVEQGPYDDEILRRQRAGEIATQEAEQTAEEQEEDRQQQINQAALDRLRAQSAAQQNRQPEGTGDWRVKLRLASGADYFYNAITQAGDDVERTAGILAPLQSTDGIIFPYTPSIQTMYQADYNAYHPTHSNYQHYFYKGSKVGEVVLTATFTAQDTAEANYLLAVIHFLKSASKMFYGQDAERGSPPPLLFLSGLGDYQFNEAPCVISQFNYILPNDVDYIRANVSQIRAGQTLQSNIRNKNTGQNLRSWSSRVNRVLTTPGLTFGAENPPMQISSQTANLSSEDATYVPTKLEMTITLLPVQNRLQVSQDFSLRQYATGDLIKRGFW